MGQQGPKNAAYLTTNLELPDLEIPVTVHPGALTLSPQSLVQLGSVVHCRQPDHRHEDHRAPETWSLKGPEPSLIPVGLKSHPASEPIANTTSSRKPSCISPMEESLPLWRLHFYLSILVINDHESLSSDFCLTSVSSMDTSTTAAGSRCSVLSK